MIKALQRKFVFIAMGSMLLVIVVLVGAINLTNLYQIDQKANGLLTVLSENGGRFPDVPKGGGHGPRPDDPNGLSPETPFETRYFLIRADQKGSVTQIDTGHIAALSSSEAQALGEAVLASGKASGYSGFYKYLRTDTGDGALLIFVDCQSQLQSAFSYFTASCLIALLSLLVVFCLVTVLSRRAMRPVAESLEKQKRFITDAGHEIKTPLSIISANTEVLELSHGKSEWTDSIRNQTRRLGGLVKSLLELSKLEEDRPPLAYTDFSLSGAVQSEAEPFGTLAELKGIPFTLSIQPGIAMRGDEESIRRLVSILADNALKYTEGEGAVTVALKKTGKYACLAVENSCKDVPTGDLNRLFDRFYRADDSRTRETGGYGIGLSIARAVAEAHRGKITAAAQNGRVTFTVLLPAKAGLEGKSEI